MRPRFKLKLPEAGEAALLDLLKGVNGVYRVFEIPKRNGGSRRISAPSERLYAIQRLILDALLSKIPVNPCAKAYVLGKGLRENLRFHLGQSVLMKADIVEFFGSINTGRVYHSLRTCGVSDELSMAVTEVCCFQGALPQGAPTSGYLSNIVMNDFDRKMYFYCREGNLRYTRYSDDLCISGRAIDKYEVLSKVSRELAALGLEANLRKFALVPRSKRQVVTGCVVNEKPSPGRAFLKDLRRELYYIEKYGIASHAHRSGLSPGDCLNSVRGRVAFAHQIVGETELIKRWWSVLRDA